MTKRDYFMSIYLAALLYTAIYFIAQSIAI